MKQALHPIMFAGTGSDVGKSIVAAAFCRIFRQDGYSPAPFKAQNMALNSYATPEGLEIGRAQAVQAEAAGIACHTDMNPLLLKPQSDHTSQVVLNGKPIGSRDAYDYWRRSAPALRKEGTPKPIFPCRGLLSVRPSGFALQSYRDGGSRQYLGDKSARYRLGESSNGPSR